MGTKCKIYIYTSASYTKSFETKNALGTQFSHDKKDLVNTLYVNFIVDDIITSIWSVEVPQISK